MACSSSTYGVGSWLWLASVAGDQAEYHRALNEVLRINPTNQRAQNLLAEFHQQQQQILNRVLPRLGDDVRLQPVGLRDFQTTLVRGFLVVVKP